MDKNYSECTILLPSYQPDKILISLSKALADLKFEVLIVNDGSDESFQYIFDECEKWAKVISYPINRGKGEALKIGFKYILEKYKKCRYVITADGDGQHCIQDIVATYDKVATKKVTIIGERNFNGKVPLKSTLGNSLSRFSQALCTYRYMVDNQCGLRAFPISLLPKLVHIHGSRYEYEMKVLNYLQMKEIPFLPIEVQTIYENNNATSHFRPVRDTLLIQGSIFLCGLINLLTFVFGLLSTTLFYEFIFKEGALRPSPISIELSLFISAPITLLFQLFLVLIIFRPKNFGKATFRFSLFRIIVLIFELIIVSFFTRVCNLPIYGAYLLCLPICMLPIYFLIKGIGVVYNSQNI